MDLLNFIIGYPKNIYVNIPETDVTMFDPENDTTSFAFILYRCAIAFRNELNREFYKEFQEEFNVDDWFILSILWSEDNIPQNLLAERVSRDKASLSRTLDYMEEKGLVQRILDASDKRG